MMTTEELLKQLDRVTDEIEAQILPDGGPRHDADTIPDANRHALAAAAGVLASPTSDGT